MKQSQEERLSRAGAAGVGSGVQRGVRDLIRQGLLGLKEFGLYHGGHGKPWKDSRKGNDTVRFVFL